MAADESRRANEGADSREHVADDDEREFRRARRRARSHDAERANLAPGITRLAYAWTQASTELVVGAVEVAGDLIANLAEDVYEGPVRERDDDDVDEESRSRRRAAGDAQSASPYRRPRGGRRLTHVIADDLSEALAQSADVLARSADRLSSTFHRTMRDDDEADEREAERVQHVAAQDQARAKQSKT